MYKDDLELALNGAGAQATGMDLLMTLWRWQTWLAILTVLLVLIVFWNLFGL